MSNTQNNSNNQVIELVLRPKKWEEYVGQEKVKSNLNLIIKAAKEREESCDHLLFHGQAGLGKTTLAHIVAQEMEADIKTTSGPSLEKTGDMAAILTNVNPHEILFIDEIHRMNKSVEEILYPALESRSLHLVVGKGPSAKTLSIDLPPFTVVGATTKANLLSSPLRSRFGAIFRLDYYTKQDIASIIKRSAEILEIPITQKAVEKLAATSRFTPRTANRLLKRSRDWAQVHKSHQIDEEAVEKTLQMMEIDSLGLEETDRRLLKTIIEKFNGGPVGIRSLAAALSEEVGTIEEVYEPFLLQIGLLKRSSNGRVVTRDSYKHLGY
ncbi:ATP-dependent DNA helicase RuvB [candidate division MSBL1 archaeon SCGC-AAA382N08]|uniref:ATP-dependent DNA helicase RuvB n=1 Tax=candidate division MSBL1 archaeon SCGC-AAA382N08 TaxID=1698285 RepID=A0A133VP98_9EURY|nr:ATP-dependent DNA helicase RuvB [candidate division MSBL1 archaeon SCGC-AAA382N08]